jgi:hypothetical protein
MRGRRIGLVQPAKMISVANPFGISRKLAGSVLALSLLFNVLAIAQSIPQVRAESLNGEPISFPKDFAGKPAILIIGFSRGGGNQCGRFARKLANEPSVVEGKVVIYEIAMLESAPRLIRAMILHGLRGGIPQAEQKRFLPLFHEEKEWKQVAGFTESAQNDAYLVLVSSDGAVRWRGRGQYSERLYSEFKRQLP